MSNSKQYRFIDFLTSSTLKSYCNFVLLETECTHSKRDCVATVEKHCEDLRSDCSSQLLEPERRPRTVVLQDNASPIYSVKAPSVFNQQEGASSTEFHLS